MWKIWDIDRALRKMLNQVEENRENIVQLSTLGGVSAPI